MRSLARCAFICLFAIGIVLVMSGCAGDAGSTDSSADAGGGTAASGEQADSNAEDTNAGATDGAAPVVDGVQAPNLADIPDGKDVSVGGNPEYTFLTLWQRGLEAALEWQPDAYLVSASGQYVNDSGVPSEWSMVFQSPSATGYEWCAVSVDPWGNATTEIRTPNGTDAEKQAARDVFGTTPITPDIIDSDAAVSVAAPALYEQYAQDKTKDPALMLNYDPARADAGPIWAYQVFYSSSAEYVKSLVDARSSDVIVVEGP